MAYSGPHSAQAAESLTSRFRRANAHVSLSLLRARQRRILPEATKVSVGIMLPDTCAALALAIRVATLLARTRNVEHTVALLVGRTVRFVMTEVLAPFRHGWGRIIWLLVETRAVVHTLIHAR